MAAGSTLWHVKGGNHLVPKQLLAHLRKQSDVQFVHGHVKSVAEVHRVDAEDEGGRVRLSYQPANSELVHSVDYDYVIVAFPLHRDNIQAMSLSSNDQFQQYDYRMQPTHANFLQGKLNCALYNLTRGQCEKLTAVFYTHPSLPYRSVAQQRTVEQSERSPKKSTEPVYKVFSPVPLSPSDYQHIFANEQYQLIQDIPWLAYPKYEHPQKLPPLELATNVFYVNAMEWSSSCMEIEAISARNIAMLLTKRLGIELKRADTHVEF